MYDQLSYTNCYGWPPSKRENLHLEKIDALPKLDWSAYKRWVIFLILNPYGGRVHVLILFPYDSIVRDNYVKYG